MAPELFDVGAVSVKGASPYCLVGIVKLDRVGGDPYWNSFTNPFPSETELIATIEPSELMETGTPELSAAAVPSISDPL
jgi:hypothetical protein